jgi:hypothetical protein
LKIVVVIGLYALMGLGLYALVAGNVSFGLTLKPFPPFSWFSISDRVTRCAWVCFVYASLFHLTWAVSVRMKPGQRIERHTVGVLLYFLGRALFFSLLSVFILALSSANITKQPFSDGALYRSILTSCFLLGAWSWNAGAFIKYLHSFLKGVGKR